MFLSHKQDYVIETEEKCMLSYKKSLGQTKPPAKIHFKTFL